MTNLTVNTGAIFLIAVGTAFFYWVNETLNKTPFLKQIVTVLIVGLGLWFLLQSLGLVHGGPVLTN